MIVICSVLLKFQSFCSGDYFSNLNTIRSSNMSCITVSISEEVFTSIIIQRPQFYRKYVLTDLQNFIRYTWVSGKQILSSGINKKVSACLSSFWLVSFLVSEIICTTRWSVLRPFDQISREFFEFSGRRKLGGAWGGLAPSSQKK